MIPIVLNVRGGLTVHTSIPPLFEFPTVILWSGKAFVRVHLPETGEPVPYNEAFVYTIPPDQSLDEGSS